MRALSVLFVVVNIYWFCYPAIREWNVSIGVVDRILLNFQRTTGLFGSILWTKLFSVAFLCPVVSRHEGCKGGKNQMGAYPDSPFRRYCPLLFFQLVAAQPARTVNGTHRLLYTHSCRRLSLPARRRCMDLPPSQTGPHGRCVQQRERKFHAGNKAYRKRIFCKSARHGSIMARSGTTAGSMS